MGFLVDMLLSKKSKGGTTSFILDEVSGAETSVNEKSVMGISAAFACIGLIAETVAQLPIKVKKRSGDKVEDFYEHPLYHLLVERPNEWQTSQEFREMLTQHLCLHGNAYALIVKDRTGYPRELLPIEPGCVTVQQDSEWNVKYTVSVNNINKELTQKDIFHIKYRTINGYEGISPISWEKNTFESTLANISHGARYFKNGARPGGIITLPGNLGEKAYNALRDTWDNDFTGDNAWRTAILQNGMDYKPMTMSNTDAQYIETRQLGVEEIARIYRVPLHMIQSTEKTTSWGSGIEQLGIGFVQTCLLPWIKRWESCISKFLIPDADKTNIYAKFSVDGLMRGDTKSRYESYGLGIQNGFLSPNEARAFEDLNAREGGDEYYIPLNMGGSERKDEAAN